MSTKGLRRSTRRLRGAVILAAAPLVATVTTLAGCRRPAGEPASLESLCRGNPAQTRVTLVVDSVRSTAGPALQELRGGRYALRLSFGGGGSPVGRCEGRRGTVRIDGTLPPPLAGAASASAPPEWHILGDRAVIELNPRARDNNLSLSLPLRGGPGRWGLSAIAGEVASGRVPTT